MDIPKPLRVLFLVAEADPFAKVGGLGDVGGSLPRAINRLKQLPDSPGPDTDNQEIKFVDIRVIIPYHGTVASFVPNNQPLVSFEVPHRDGPLPAFAYQQDMEGVPVYLISGGPIPKDKPIYTGDPGIDGNKYVFFSMAALELVKALNWPPDLIHANDWHTAPAIYAIKIQPDYEGYFGRTSTLLGIHNLPYLGSGTEPSMSEYNLPPATGSLLPDWAQHLPLPLGLLSADHIVTVSPTYAKEILSPEFGAGLNDFLQRRSTSISGILNGLDEEAWNPRIDPCLAANYNHLSLDKRVNNKRALQIELELEPDPSTLIFSMVMRMENQKGVDLALDALRQIEIEAKYTSYRWQAIFLGTGSSTLEEAVRRMQADFPTCVRALIGYDAPLSRRIFAGADAMLFPSRYEPCGLAQMIAMHYGCVPIARAVGGLKDTIRPYPGDNSSGFLFLDPTPEALSGTIRSALALYSDRNAWRKLQLEGMVQDFSWERSACQYISLYRSLVTP
jgi:starch synthase